jgi:hypothetical protein
MTRSRRCSAAALCLLTGLWPGVGLAQETVTFQVPVTIEGFDPIATVRVQLNCFLVGAEPGQTWGGGNAILTLTNGGYSGTVSVTAERHPGTPKPAGWACLMDSWWIRYPWETSDHFCYYGLDNIWPCKNMCPGSGPTPCKTQTRGSFE